MHSTETYRPLTLLFSLACLGEQEGWSNGTEIFMNKRDPAVDSSSRVNSRNTNVRGEVGGLRKDRSDYAAGILEGME